MDSYLYYEKNLMFYVFLDGVSKITPISLNNVNINWNIINIGWAGPTTSNYDSNNYYNSIRFTRFARYDTLGFIPPAEKYYYENI